MNVPAEPKVRSNSVPRPLPGLSPARASGREPRDKFELQRETRKMARFRDSRSELHFKQLYDETSSALLAMIRSMLRARATHLDPLEVLQDTYVSIFRYAGSFRDEHPRSFRVWSRTIALNLIRRAKQESWRPSLQDMPEGLQEPADERTRPEMAVQLGEEGRRIARNYNLYLLLYYAAWKDLSDRDRKALEIVEVEGLSYSEACEVLGVGMSNMKMIMFRARRRIRDRIQGSLEGLVEAHVASLN